VLLTNVQEIHHGSTTEYIIPVSDEEVYRVNLVYVLPIVAALLLLIWWRVRKKKQP
jgi:hypothetical protein